MVGSKPDTPLTPHRERELAVTAEQLAAGVYHFLTACQSASSALNTQLAAAQAGKEQEVHQRPGAALATAQVMM